jgi:hypothetical protein
MKPVNLFLLLFIIAVSSTLLLQPERSAAQTAPNSDPIIVVLTVDGGAEYRKPIWNAKQLLQPGTFVSTADFVYFQNATLSVLCPDASWQVFQPGTLFPNDIIPCPTEPVRIGQGDEKRILRQKGGAQGAGAPYLIFPRATIVRTKQVTLRWNAISDAESYTILVIGGGQPVQSDRLLPADVVQGNVGMWALPIDLTEKTAYSVVICVRYVDMHERCTNNDPEWENNADLSFYYVQTQDLDTAETAVLQEMGSESLDVQLFARAVLLSRDVPISDTKALGVYGEAIPLLEQLIQTIPNSALAQSPETYLLLGDLYRAVSLPQSSNTAYEKAAQLSEPASEAAARAALDLAMVATDTQTALTHYQEGFQDLEKLLTPAAYDERLKELCDGAGDLKFDLKPCDGT